ncbi:MAG: OsmC family protein [Thermoplasmata archaeon]|nr:OsmC family protein [Thermoplasmata archaeon]
MGDIDRAVELDQVERYRFEARYPGQPFGPAVVDEPAPTGGSAGPGPIRSLATAVGHCMSSTLLNTLERAHVPVTTIHCVVDVEVGRNPQGRLRVQSLRLQIHTTPVHPEDQPRFDHCVAIFEDFCTVSGAVRVGIPIETHVGPGAG